MYNIIFILSYFNIKLELIKVGKYTGQMNVEECKLVEYWYLDLLFGARPVFR